MACPLFIPSSPTGELVSIAAPLGDLYNGQCAADLSANIDPGLLRSACNFGYARETCPRAARSDVDAARFLIQGEHEGVVKVAWSLERDHHPVAVGTSHVATGQPGPSEADTMTRQTLACALAYIRQLGISPSKLDPTSRTGHP